MLRPDAGSAQGGQKMTAPTIITCGDLAALAGPWSHLWRHDPEHMVAGEDALCHCYGRCPPQDTDPVACRALLPVPLHDGLTLRICCLCASYFADVLRVAEVKSGGELHRWLRRQVCEADLWRRERQRLDSSPAPCDMDVQASAVLDQMEGDDR